MSLQPPDDWDFTIHDVRLVIDEARLPAGGCVEAVKRILYDHVVTLEWYEGGVWALLATWPAWQLPCGGMGVAAQAHPLYGLLPARPPALREPQSVRAARTRLALATYSGAAAHPEPAYLVVDGMDRGRDELFPVWSKRSPFVLSTARDVPSEAP